MANGEILDALEVKIKEALSQKKLTQKERMNLEINQMFVIFLKSDRDKVMALSPQVAELWDKHTADKENTKERRKMIVAPFYSNLVQLGVQVIINIGIVFLAMKFFDK